jgi:hypothetical protein
MNRTGVRHGLCRSRRIWERIRRVFGHNTVAFYLHIGWKTAFPG